MARGKPEPDVFLEAARRRPEFSAVNTTFTPAVPQLFADVNQDGRNDLLVFVRFAAPQVYLQGDGGTFSGFTGQESRDWLLKPTIFVWPLTRTGKVRQLPGTCRRF